MGRERPPSVDPRRLAVHVQVHSARKGPNPAALVRVRRRDDLRAPNHQGVRVVRRGIGGIQEGFLPRFEVFWGREIDIGEKMLSDARDPWFGDDAAIPQRLWFVMQEVDDVIEDFWWETWV